MLKIKTFLGPEMATHIHKITNVPVFLYGASLCGQLEGMSTENLDFLGPKW
jgi:hypothetical protein